MQGMTKLLGKSNQNVNINNIQQIIEGFNMQMEQQENIGEMMQDAFDQDEEEIDDRDVDEYIDNVSDRVGGGQGGQKNKLQNTDDDFGNMIEDLKK